MEKKEGLGDELLFPVTSDQIEKGNLFFFFLPCFSFILGIRTSCMRHHLSQTLLTSVDLC